jgi:potassium-dependent mechanosensitive channel
MPQSPRLARAARLRAILALAILGCALAVGVHLPVLAQGNAEVPRELVRPRGLLTGFKSQLDQIESSLGGRALTDDALRQLRDQTDVVAGEVEKIIEQLSPRADAIKARLDQLGSKPAAGAPPESPEIAKERDERQSEFSETGETLRLAGSLLVQARQINERIIELRRAAFTRTLFTRSASLLSPDLWLSVAASLPADVSAARILVGDWLSALVERASGARFLVLLVSWLAAAALFVARARLKPRLAKREAHVVDASRLRRSLTGVWRIVLITAPMAAAAWLIYTGLNGAYPMPQHIEPVVRAILVAIVFVTGARALAETVLAPGKPGWRILKVDDATAERLNRLVFVGTVIIALGKVVEVMLQQIGGALTSTIAMKGLFAVLAALLLADTLRRLSSTGEAPEADTPRETVEPSFGGTFRIIAWALVIVVVGDAVVGFIALASFLVDQVVWIALVGTVLALALIVVDETIGRAFDGKSRLVLALHAGIGLRRRSLDQISVLASGILRMLFVVAAVLLVLAPWGVESTDIASSLRAALFGLSVGGVTFSVSTVVGALILFIGAIVATRAVQRWLERRYLPVTQLDAGLRNSISTAVGYLGVFVAAGLALAQLGLGLDRIAIVAGALSVGIGFGLQSIVNNFVSGLILLWERSIRVGDWIVVGNEQGYVRRINVRATEIETFDRAEVIVPNSNLVSGVVKNWLHNNRTGRIVIPVSVVFGPDPKQVAELLIDCAHKHAEVLREPPASVLFNKFSNTALEFELRCFVVDVERSLRVRSDLHFAIFARLQDERILIGAVDSNEVMVKLPEHVETLIAGLAQARATYPRRVE